MSTNKTRKELIQEYYEKKEASYEILKNYFEDLGATFILLSLYTILERQNGLSLQELPQIMDTTITTIDLQDGGLSEDDIPELLKIFKRSSILTLTQETDLNVLFDKDKLISFDETFNTGLLDEFK